MPHTTAAMRRIVEARINCTGEPRRLAIPAIRALSTQAGTLPPPLPEASTTDQQELESRVLLALARACRERSGPRGTRYPVSYVSPTPHALELKLRTASIPYFVSALVPRWSEDDVYGMPGLRARPHRRGIVLTMLDRSGKVSGARVLLKDVTADSWAKALAWSAAGFTEDRAKRSWVHDVDLSFHERRHMHTFPRFYAHPLLASALLRRIHLLASACWIDAWTDSAVKIEWCHGPKLGDVARSLTSPVVGIRAPFTLLTPERTHDSEHQYRLVFEGPSLPLLPHFERLNRQGVPGILELRQQDLC
jgi:hypothetical protein